MVIEINTVIACRYRIKTVWWNKSSHDLNSKNLLEFFNCAGNNMLYSYGLNCLAIFKKYTANGHVNQRKLSYINAGSLNGEI